MLYDELELPDAVGALDDVPSADPDERLRFIALGHYGTKQAYERASRLGSGMLSRRSHVRTKAFYASYRCFSAVLSERSFRDLFRYHLEALLWLVVGLAFPGRQLRSSQAELAKAFHFILHNAARAHMVTGQDSATNDEPGHSGVVAAVLCNARFSSLGCLEFQEAWPRRARGVGMPGDD